MVSLPLWAPAAVLDGIEIRVSTREGGVSPSPYDSLNLADHVGDKAESVDENRRRLAEALPGHAVCWLNQVHGVSAVEAAPGVVPDADAHWTASRNLPLAVLTADCLPVVLMARDASCVEALQKKGMNIRTVWRMQKRITYIKRFEFHGNM